jgi:pSer/pThr/pTyr-binding forkhead associated (FHA) protein
MPTLTYYDFDKIERTIDLGAEPLLIGRAVECQIRTEDAVVSRRHARIVFDGAEYWVEDLGSLSGVYVGTEKVARARVVPGEPIVMGSLVIRMLAEAPPSFETENTESQALAAAQLELAHQEIEQLKGTIEQLRTEVATAATAATAAAGPGAAAAAELQRAREDVARERKVRQAAVDGEKDAHRKLALLTK